MTKKDYKKPTTKVVELQHRTHILAGSLTSVKLSGLDTENDLLYDDNGGNQGNAW
jgi:hypothetical protein